MRLIGYPETIRICAEHMKPSCQACLNRSLDASPKVSNILFSNPILVDHKPKAVIYE
jgi:hypothetical protein